MNKIIVFVISTLEGGGAARVMVNIANEFASNTTNKVYIISLSDNKCIYNLNQNLNIIYLNFPPVKLSITGTLLRKINLLKTLYSAIKVIKPNIIISFQTITNIKTILVAKLLNIPVIISERTNASALKSKYWKKIRSFIYPFADGMVVLSNYDFNHYYYVKNKKIIHNPIIENNQVPFSFKEKIILAVGSLYYHKGFDMLIDAISKIDINDWKVVILGEGSEREALQKQINSYGLQDNIILKGQSDCVDDYYKVASIFILSSRHEGFPNVLAEALSYGCSCIAFDCKTGPSEMLNNDINGYLVEPNNGDLLSSRIQDTIENNEKRKLLYNEAIKIKDTLGIINIISQWNSYINDIIKKGN